MTDNTFADVVAGNVRYVMGGRRLRTKQVAEDLGMTYASFNARHTGRVEWRLSELEPLAAALGVTMGQLLHGPHVDTAAPLAPISAPIDLRPTDKVVNQLAAQVAAASELVGRLRAELDRVR